MSDALDSVAWSGDGRFVAASNGYWINVWDAISGAAFFNPLDLEGHPVAPQLGKGPLRLYGVSNSTAFALSPDGRWLVTAADEINLYNVGTGQIAASLKAGERLERSYSDSGVKLGRHPAAFSPDGTVLATATTADHEVRLWQVGKEGVLRPLGVLKGHLDAVSALAFSPDGKRLVSGGGRDRSVTTQYTQPGREDFAVRIWDGQTGKLLHTLRAHYLEVNGVAFSADGRHVVSASEDRQTVVWDAQTGGQLALLLSTGAEWVVVTPEGLFDGSPAGLRDLVAWRFANNETAPLEVFFNEFYHPGVLGEILAGQRPRAPSSLARKDRRQPSLGIALAPVEGPVQPVTARRVTLRIEVAEAPPTAAVAAGSGTRDVRLFRNGSLVKVWRGDVLPKGASQVTLEASVPIVAGENRFTAYAFNRDNIKSADATLVVKGTDSLKRQGTAYVLAIGVNHYANPDYDLSYAVADATAFAEEIRRQQADGKTFARVEVVAMSDAEATKANILSAFARLAGEETAPSKPGAPAALVGLKPVEPEDAVFVFYAGHGTAAGPRFYLIPHDLGYAGKRTALDAAGLKAILDHGISDVELEHAFEKVGAGHLVLVIDACNSGQALEAEEKRRGPMNSKGLAQLAYEKGMYVLTAAQGYQAALEVSQLGHGLLTYALVEEGLKKAAADAAPRDGQVLVREWLDYPTERVPQMQAEVMRAARKAGRELVFVEGEQAVAEVDKRSVQRPRVFYRREVEDSPLVIARPSAAPTSGN